MLVFVLGWLGLLGQAYVPAQPTNDSALIQAGVNESDTSMLNLQWCVTYFSASASSKQGLRGLIGFLMREFHRLGHV